MPTREGPLLPLGAGWADHAAECLSSAVLEALDEQQPVADERQMALTL